MVLPRGRTFTLGFALLMAIGLGAAYSNSLSIGFLFDDIYGIAQNPALRSLRNIPRFFVDPFTLTSVRENVDVRPVLQVTYAVNYAISGLAPWSYHLLNLLLHFAGAMLVFLLVRDHLYHPANQRGPDGAARLLAAAAALFFALAPLATQTVDYLWARSALLSTTLYLGAFLACLRQRWAVMALVYSLALLTKAIAITLPLVIALYDFLYRDRNRYPTLLSWLRDFGRLLIPVGVPAALAVAYFCYRAALLPQWAEATRHEAFVSPLVWFMSQWSAYLYYGWQFVWPSGLSIDHEFPYTFHIFSSRALLALLGLLVWVGLAARVAKWQPMLAFATAWFFVTLAPESTFAALAEVVNDHRPYIGSALGLSVLVAWLLRRVTTFGARGDVIFACLCLVIGGVAAVGVHVRNAQWNDSLTLWVDAATKGPNLGRAQMNAGREYMMRGDLESARRYFERARRVTSVSYPYLHINLSALAVAEGNLDAALRSAQDAVRTGPGLALSHAHLASVLERMGRTDQALAEYRTAAMIDPGAEESQMRIGLDALSAGHFDQAAACFRRVLEMRPDHYGATYQLASALDAAGLREQAQPFWERVLEMAQGYRDRATIETARQRLGK